MKKSKPRTQTGRTGKARKAKPGTADPDHGRRNAIRLIRNGVIAAAAVGAVGLVSVRAVRATAAEMDLSRIGSGTPVVVQIHDPSCALCTELQRNTRRAFKAFRKDDLTYLVANINTTDGAVLAARYGVQHVTLLLFNGAGDMVQSLEGVRPWDELERHFADHLADHSG